MQPPRRIKVIDEDINKTNCLIAPDTAIRLGCYLGTSAEFWMNLQTQYDLAVARRKLSDELKVAS